MDIEILKEVPLSLIDIKERLEGFKKQKKELNFRSVKVLDQLNENIKIKKKDAEQLKKELGELNLIRIKEKNLIKIIDIMPTTQESIKSLFSGDNITLKQEDLSKIEEVVKKYV
ncbi:hypothetical protein J4436_03805 [Candidatus Woesearchaeota archaeon]|nr:hypothetical protein [Candidatus Woesearchaeota archaeon]